MRSLVFETPPLDEPIEILGAAVVTLEIASDKPMANLVVRLCDVHPSGESLRVSYGVLNLTHRDGHEKPALLAAGRALPRPHPAQRCRLGVSGRPPHQAGALDDLLADDLASSREGDAADFGRHARSAGAPAADHRRAARRCPVRSRHHPRSRRSAIAIICASSASTASASSWARRQIRASPRGGRSAERDGRAAADVDDVAGRMADSHRDADAALLHARRLPAAGKFTRVGRRERSLSSRMGSLYSARLRVTM